jgi:Mlc titration factor MtfA (ptsG expression regulator)
MFFARLLSVLLAVFLSIVVYEGAGAHTTEWLFLEAGALVISVLAYRALSKKYRIRESLRNAEFPAEWEKILTENVDFYNSLNPEEKARFRYEIQCFIAEKRINGIGTTIEDKDRLLVACSAIIPIFGFPEWEYTNLKEVLLYSGSFREDFSTEGKQGRNILGMVGNGYMNGMMILSLPQLQAGFRESGSKSNVGIHEFVHLLDKSDGNVDGLPQTLMDDKAYAKPWLDLMQKEISAIKKGKSDINAYGAMAQEEFFAVASEYFFQRPDLLKEKHPELYNLLSRMFRQNTASRLKRAFTSVFKRKKMPLRRNDPCPCGSGLKYKKCCGKA